MFCDLNRMHQTPGIYVVVGPSGLCAVEIDDRGVCYQLKPSTFERDGELSRHGWNHPSNTFHCVGPFARPAT